MSKRDNILRIGINILFYACVAVIIWLFLHVFFYASFRVPTGSMEPEIWPGDYVLVNKLILGARLFNLMPTLRLEQVDIHRAPGIRKIRRNDVVVFNTPYPHSEERMEMHILKYLIKRCVGLPGDSLRIENGYYRVEGVDEPLGNPEQQRLRPENRWPGNLYEPVRSCIPAKGDTVPMNREHYILYKSLIEWETKGELTLREDTNVYLNNRLIRNYIFDCDYYFMAGDNVQNSIDSRYWGLVPGDYIVGKAWLIWKSEDSYTNKFRWNRWMKQIK
ncbi:MAG: signal peptidase I [Tannerellaceae bacterium]|jgi:signal peptidase I|nr:signal peptidase I [Tannerellaceae bacterium]